MQLTTKMFSDSCKEVYNGAVRIGVIRKMANDQWAAYTVGESKDFPKGIRVEDLPMNDDWEIVLEMWRDKVLKKVESR